MEEAERDIVPINEEIAKLAFRLDETEKTKELSQQVREGLKSFVGSFRSINFTAGIQNADLKKIIREIRVMSPEEISVHFNVDHMEGLAFPIALEKDTGTDSDTEDRT